VTHPQIASFALADGRYVIGTVLDFNPVDDCPLWLAMLNDVMDESRVNL
jgi:hypothetical protein